MKGCSFPDCEEEESIPFKCKLCDQYFCSKHRLPEQHLCPKITVFQSEEYKKAKLSISRPKTAEESQPKIKQYSFDQKRKKIKKSRQHTISTFKERRTIHKSPMLTLYSFKNNFINILAGSIYVFILTSLSIIFAYSIFGGFAISVWGPMFGYITIGYFLATILIYSGHMLFENYYAKRKGSNISHVLWLQGLLVGLIGVFLPFLFHPNFILFRDFTDTEDSGKIALSGVVWMFSIEIIGFILFVFSITGLINLSPIINIALGRILITYLIYLLFSLFPFFYNNGFYIARWNRKLNWSLIGGIFVLTLTMIILDFIFLVY